jgi:hypothetical protein
VSADRDFIISVREVSAAIMKKIEDGDIELEQVPDLFDKAGQWLKLQNEWRMNWLFGSVESQEVSDKRATQEALLQEELF